MCAPRNNTLLALLMLALTAWSIGGATDRRVQAAGPGTAEQQAAESPPAAADDRQREKAQAVQVAFLLLAGVACVGLALLGLVVLWGFRLRRIVRAPLPEVSGVDPLWYLRKGRQTAPDRSEDTDGSTDSDPVV